MSSLCAVNLFCSLLLFTLVFPEPLFRLSNSAGAEQSSIVLFLGMPSIQLAAAAAEANHYYDRAPQATPEGKSNAPYALPFVRLPNSISNEFEGFVAVLSSPSFAKLYLRKLIPSNIQPKIGRHCEGLSSSESQLPLRRQRQRQQKYWLLGMVSYSDVFSIAVNFSADAGSGRNRRLSSPGVLTRVFSGFKG